MTSYQGLTFEQLAKHADEGWGLANSRTLELREAVEALRGAAHVIECWAYHHKQDANGNPNLQDMFKVLEWGGRMFPEPGSSHHDIDETPKQESPVGPELPAGESMHDLS